MSVGYLAIENPSDADITQTIAVKVELTVENLDGGAVMEKMDHSGHEAVSHCSDDCLPP